MLAKRFGKLFFMLFCIVGLAANSYAEDEFDKIFGKSKKSSSSSSSTNSSSNSNQRQGSDDSSSQDQAPMSAEQLIRDQAFSQLLEQSFPLQPDEVLRLKKELRRSKAVATLPAAPPPQPVSATLQVDISPGASSPVIRLAKGFVTTMVFVDATGQPWPPADYSIGNSKDFNIQWDRQTNTFFVQAMKEFVHTNMAMRMSGLDSPIVLSFVTDQREVDYRVDLQVQARGPNATTPLSPKLPQSTPNYLISALDGLPPNGSRQLKVNGIEAQAWLYNNKLILRTNHTLLSPAWGATLSSVDGTKVYEITPVPSILVSVNGKPNYATFSGI